MIVVHVEVIGLAVFLPHFFQKLVPARVGAVELIAQRVFFVVVLMVVLGREEILHGQYFGGDGFAEPTRFGQGQPGCLGGRFLPVIVKKDRSPVLSTAVDKLAPAVRGR